MAEQITQRQAEVLRFIMRRIEADGYPPSMRDICAGMGIAGPSGVAPTLERLAAKGYVELGPYSARGVRVLRDETGRRVRLAHVEAKE
jgi:repressor LexA